MSARRVAGGVVLLLALAACDPSITPAAPGVSMDVGPDGAEFGRAFPLTVRRSWRAGVEPPPWDDAQLAPLLVRATDEAQRTDAGRVSEFRRFDAYAFRAGDVTVPSAKATISVRHAVDPAKPGAAELPGEPMSVPVPRALLTLAAAAAIAAAALLVRRFRARKTPPATPALAETAPPPSRPHTVALSRLAELRAATGNATLHADAAALLRRYVRERFGVGALEMTSEDLAADVRVADTERRRLLGSVLVAADVVKFGFGAASAADRERLLDDAETFVRGTVSEARDAA